MGVTFGTKQWNPVGVRMVTASRLPRVGRRGDQPWALECKAFGVRTEKRSVSDRKSMPLRFRHLCSSVWSPRRLAICVLCRIEGKVARCVRAGLKSKAASARAQPSDDQSSQSKSGVAASQDAPVRRRGGVGGEIGQGLRCRWRWTSATAPIARPRQRVNSRRSGPDGGRRRR
jgi:hypothetical protein